VSKWVELPTGLCLVADVGCESPSDDLTWHILSVGVLELEFCGCLIVVLRFMKHKY
jgi:hypothetical protein